VGDRQNWKKENQPANPSDLKLNNRLDSLLFTEISDSLVKLSFVQFFDFKTSNKIYQAGKIMSLKIKEGVWFIDTEREVEHYVKLKKD